jgi:hypothetical protein
VHDTHDARRFAGIPELGAEDVEPVGALEQKQIGARDQKALERQIHEPRGRPPTVVEAAAMGRIGPHRPGAREPRIGAAFGTVPVQHFGTRVGGPARHMRDRGHVTRTDLPAHGHTAHAERKQRRQVRERGFRPGAAGGRVDDEADPVPALRLAARQIEHMPKQPADRGAQHVQDVEACGRRVDGTDPTKTGVNALMIPTKTGVNALMLPRIGANAAPSRRVNPH